MTTWNERQGVASAGHYVSLDIFSRYIVGWMIAAREHFHTTSTQDGISGFDSEPGTRARIRTFDIAEQLTDSLRAFSESCAQITSLAPPRLSFQLEKEPTVAAVNPRHTPWPASTGMVARHAPELVAGMDWNTHAGRKNITSPTAPATCARITISAYLPICICIDCITGDDRITVSQHTQFLVSKSMADQSLP